MGWRCEISRSTALPLHVLARAGLPDAFATEAAQELASGQVTVHASKPRAEVDALIGGALALIYLSTDEGFGLPVIEAMAIGTPVVTGNAPATREVARDAGLLVDTDDVVGSGADHVERLRDPAYRATVADAGRRVAADHRWATVAGRYARVYESVLR
jgi:glycosyltransferase involved in cell wall biosynthesis